ncbi:MAG: N-acetylmuramoyl-L-alanine amidase [Pseudomonadota bacterium]|nr:N-acetylmuramoyl-L-alanine amidase [Pseudomonadota bacterium]
MSAARNLWTSGWARALAALTATGCVLIAATGHGADAGGVLGVRVAGDAAETRIVVELDQSAKAKLVAEAETGQLVLAWPELDAGKALSGTGKGLVGAWSVDEAAGAVRLKLELNGGAEVARRFLLPPGDGQETYRYVIDLKANGQQVAAQSRDGTQSRARSRTGAGKSAASEAAVRAPVQTISAPKAAVGGKKVIVIDAGHGGRDPGAVGVRARESAVTLAAAQALRAQLTATGRYKVVMTREKDVYIPLETRVRIARQAKADLFISLHADAGPDATVRGASVYTLSEHGSDRAAKSVMSKDRSLGDFKLPGKDASVNQILLDLTQRATRNQSATFAQLLLNSVDDTCVLLRRSHRDAGYVVLLAPDVPAVLLEMGFMTNAEDEAVLSDPKQRGAMMAAVSRSIDGYFSQQATYAAR